MPSDTVEQATEIFPYPSYRDHQRKSLIEAAEALYEDGYQNVILNLPTGIGKSAINVTLAELADSAFITTPQKALRRQLEEDTDLREHYSTLRARDDYTCITGSQQVADSVSCKKCPINNSSDKSCIDQPNCEYWESKQDAIDDRIAVLESAELIQREEAVYEGQRTYYLEPTARDLNFSLLMAGDMLSPFVGDEEVDPQSDAFSQWLMNLAYEEE